MKWISKLFWHITNAIIVTLLTYMSLMDLRYIEHMLSRVILSRIEKGEEEEYEA